jgi:uncharacterized membrane protein YkoI
MTTPAAQPDDSFSGSGSCQGWKPMLHPSFRNVREVQRGDTVMNENPNRLKRTLSAVAIAAGLGLGAAGVASAVSGGGQTTTPTAGAAEGAEVQDPSYTASIQAPESESATEDEAAEAAALQALAKISPDQAKQAALAAVPGTVDKVELENENGNVVYGVEITANGTRVDVKVDAGNGSVLAQDTDDGTEADESGPEAPESGPEAPEAPAASGA